MSNIDLKWLAGSEPRVNVLLSLLEGPKDVGQLEVSTGHTKSTVGHYIKPMVDEGMVEKVGAGYRLSDIGRLHAVLLHGIVGGLDVIEENRDFWVSHDLSSIPDRLQAKIGMLSGCQCVQDNGFVMKSLDNFLREVAKANRVWGVSSVIAPGHVELISGLLNAGTDVSLILTREILSLIDPATLRFWTECEGFTLYEMPDTCQAAFTVTDEMLSLGLYLPNGQYDTNQDLVCRGEKAVAWGRELFEHYKRRGKVVR